MLQHKREAELCAGAFARYQPITSSERSRFSPSDPSARVELGLGYLQAVLAALHGVVVSVVFDATARSGRADLRSTGGTATYRFSWNDTDRLLLGGFVHSAGQPTYQAALIALVQAIALARCGQIAQGAELVERWYGLVGAMERIFPRCDPATAWERTAIAAACAFSHVRPLLLGVCDALRICLAYRLPELSDRAPGVVAYDVAEPGTSSAVPLPASLLLSPTGLSPAVPSTPGTEPSADGASPSSKPTIPATPAMSPSRARSKRTPRPASPVNEAATPPVPSPAVTPITGGHIARIQLALARGGPLMLVGPTATGKTTQTIAAASALGWGVEAITLDAGWEADDLFGSFTRTRHDHEWLFVPGPVTRWAERATSGERVLLLLDELARGHATVVSAVMRLMNEHTRDAVVAMNLPVPDGEDGPFHIVDIRATQQRLVLPCCRVRIVATANQGEGYTGLDLSDPAFGRRFTGGWLYLSGYAPDETARIVASRLGLAPNTPLIRAMQQVALQVLAYQQKEDVLRATLDLATLIAWGSTTLAIFHHDSAPGRGDARHAFQNAARDTWLDRLCPLTSTGLDTHVEHALLDFVTSAAPASLT